MAGAVIFIATAWGCAALFLGMGIFAERREKPMWFWSGTEVDASRIKDVRQYNRENAAMWKLYSLWYAAAGIAGIWNVIAFLIIISLGGTAGLALLIWRYKRIFEKYRVR